MKFPSDRRAPEGARPAWRPISFWPWTLAAAAAVLVGASVAIILLLTIANGAEPGTDRANARLDAVRTGLAVGAGIGAAAGLVLAFRRQHHQEIATVLTDRDATERRITEQYTKAAEQLDSDKASVRLLGLKTLERLAQDNPAHRQTVVDVVCAYLRMPFSSMPAASKPQPGAAEALGKAGTEAETRTTGSSDTWWQETEVRLTAQRILTEHLRAGTSKDEHSADPANSRFWPNIRLNLARAALIDFSLENCVMADADFSWANFSGMYGFSGATFDGFAWFGRATFDGFARFDGATFSGNAGFAAATFRTGADFRWATFSGNASFGGGHVRDILFYGATFSRDAVFQVATFWGDAEFDGTVFGGKADFHGATFEGNAGFAETTFSGRAKFEGAIFSGNVRFDAAIFNGGESSLSFERSRVLSVDAEDVWPAGWCLEPQSGSDEYMVVRANEDSRSRPADAIIA